MLSAALIGVSLSMDALAISVTSGLTQKGFSVKDAVRMGLYFGFFQFIMPLAGCFLAGTVSDYISMLGPYISFCLLGFVGGRMIWEALHEKGDEENVAPAERMSAAKLFALAVATSIDALAVGVSFAFQPEVRLFQSCIVIGVVTFLICLVGGMLGKRIPWLSGSRAEVFGGAVLCAIGLKLLIEGVFLK